MKTIILALVVAFIIPSANAQYKSLELTDTTSEVLPKPKLVLKPSPKFDDEIGQFFLGNLAGGLVGVGGALVGVGIEKAGGSHGEMSGLFGGTIGFVVGHCAGSILGVYTVGSAKDVSGDLSSTILGGIGGTGAGITYLYLVKGSTPLSYLAAAFPTAGAMIGFNSTLYYKVKKNVSEIKDSGTHFKIKNDFEVNVIKVNFEIPKASELSKIPEQFLLSLK